jgi:hypothetical protein
MSALRTQIIEIHCGLEDNTDQLPCKSCEEVGDTVYFTPMGAGPFCSDCLDSLCDPDQALALEERLAAYEHQRR